MKRIDTATKAADLFGAGKHGYQDGNPLTGTAPTQLNAAQFNHLQEEIARVIEATGTPLNAASYTQLLEAINAIVAAAIGALPELEVSPYGSYVTTADPVFDIVDAHAARVVELTAGGQLLNLPAVGGRSGFPITVVNKAVSGDVTIEPNASQTLDGFTNRLLRPGDSVQLTCTGLEWRTTAGLYSFTSNQLATVPLNLSASVAHGLRRRPDFYEVWALCVVDDADGAWTAGSMVNISAEAASGVGGVGISADDTYLRYHIGTPYGLTISDNDGSYYMPDYHSPGLSKWRLITKAWSR